MTLVFGVSSGIQPINEQITKLSTDTYLNKEIKHALTSEFQEHSGPFVRRNSSAKKKSLETV